MKETVSVKFTPRQLDAVLEVITKEQEQYSVQFAPERIVELRAVIKEMVDAINSQSHLCLFYSNCGGLSSTRQLGILQ